MDSRTSIPYSVCSWPFCASMYPWVISISFLDRTQCNSSLLHLIVLMSNCQCTDWCADMQGVTSLFLWYYYSVDFKGSVFKGRSSKVSFPDEQSCFTVTFPFLNLFLPSQDALERCCTFPLRSYFWCLFYMTVCKQVILCNFSIGVDFMAPMIILFSWNFNLSNDFMCVLA